MAKKRPQPEGTPIPPQTEERKDSRHGPRNMIALPDDVYEGLKELAERNDRPITRQVKSIIIEVLRREGLWPRPASSG